MAGNHPRYSLVESTVRGHAGYGLVVRSVDGEDGFVDSGHIANGPLATEDWPAVGQRIWGVVLGYARDGRLRLSTAPNDVALARSTDLAVAMLAWRDLREADERYLATARDFLQRPDATAVLRWAVTGPYRAEGRAAAVRLLATSSVETRSALAVELLRRVSEGDDPTELAGILAPVDDERLSGVLPDVAGTMTGSGARRLAGVFRSVGATRSLQHLRTLVLASPDPEVRAVGRELADPDAAT